ncbi:MAG: zinc-finger-containing protein [bacterium]|nr:zinc-finger-containing protein [bacterium]
MTLKNSNNGLFWGCPSHPACTGLVRAQPSGWPVEPAAATSSLRAWRHATHSVFDLVWNSRPIEERPRAREDAYAWLAQVLACQPEEAHIGLCTRGQCLHVLVACVLRLGSEKAGATPRG